MTLTLNSIVSVSKQQLASQLGGETVILGLTAGRYYGLEGVGARVWQLLQAPVAVSQVVDTVVAEYEVEQARCETDIIGIIEQMIAAELVEAKSCA